MAGDRLIDDVARSLTAVEPDDDSGAARSGTMRARVMAAIAESNSRPRRWTTPAWAGAFAAIAVAVVMAGALLRNSTPAALKPVDVTAVPATGSARSVEPSPVPPGTRLTAPRVRTVDQPRRFVEPTADEVAWQARAVPPLPEPVALSVDVSQPEPVQIPLLDVEALVTVPLDVPPLDSGDSTVAGGA